MSGIRIAPRVAAELLSERNLVQRNQIDSLTPIWCTNVFKESIDTPKKSGDHEAGEQTAKETADVLALCPLFSSFGHSKLCAHERCISSLE